MHALSSWQMRLRMAVIGVALFGAGLSPLVPTLKAHFAAPTVAVFTVRSMTAYAEYVFLPGYYVYEPIAAQLGVGLMVGATTLTLFDTDDADVSQEVPA